MREMKHSMRKAGTALLSALFVLPSLAQSPGNVTLELNKVSLLQALQQLKSQTQARFVYSDEELRTAPLVTLSVDDASLAGFLTCSSATSRTRMRKVETMSTSSSR